MNVGADEYGHRIRPRNTRVLVPPASHHDRHIETEHKRQWNLATVFRTVFGNGDELPANRKTYMDEKSPAPEQRRFP